MLTAYGKMPAKSSVACQQDAVELNLIHSLILASLDCFTWSISSKIAASGWPGHSEQLKEPSFFSAHNRIRAALV